MATDYERRLRRALADEAALSRFHFHCVYNAVVGETAANIVRRMRLHRAAVALVQGTDLIATIAKRVGYPSGSFTRAFSGHYGLTPAAFRNRGELRPFPLLIARKGPLMFPVTTRTDPARRL